MFFGTVIAFWISAICGGGASLILIPILNLFLPTSVVPFSLTVGTFTSSVSRITAFEKHINRKIFFWFVPFSIPAVLLGAFLIKYINPDYLQLIIALFLIANLPQLFKSKEDENKTEKPCSTIVLAIIGFLAGFVSGITGAVGLLFNHFYLKFGLTKEEVIATRAANEVFLHLVKLIIYISLGLYSNVAFWLGLTIAVATVVSAYTVKYILPYLSEFLFKKMGYTAMVVSGMVLLVGTSSKIISQDQIAYAVVQSSIYLEKIDMVIHHNIDDDGDLEIEKFIPFDKSSLFFKKERHHYHSEEHEHRSDKKQKKHLH